MECKEVQIGPEFNLFLLEDGTIHLIGAITQEGMNVINTFDKLVSISDRMLDRTGSFVKFKTI